MVFLHFLRQNARWLSAGVLLTMMSSFGQTFLISVFAGEVRAEFGLSHGAWGLIYSVGTMLSAVVMVWAGVATDHFRVRKLGTLVIFGLALSCLAMALNLWAGTLILCVFLLRFFGQGMLSHIATVAMARWFVSTRGKALAIAGLGYSVCEALLPLIFVSLLSWGIGWRHLWFMSAFVVLLALPVLLSLLREEREPKHLAQSNDAVGMQNKHWTRAEALRHPLFWFVLPTVLGPSAFVTALFFQQVHLADIKGWSHLQVVGLFPVYTGAAILSMMVFGWAVDRFGTRPLFPMFQLLLTAGFAVMAFANTPTVALVAFVLLGLAAGANGTLTPAFWAEIYGTAHIGAIKALAAAGMVLGSAIGPGLTGALIDLNFGLETQFLAMAVWFLFASGLLGFGIARFSR